MLCTRGAKFIFCRVHIPISFKKFSGFFQKVFCSSKINVTNWPINAIVRRLLHVFGSNFSPLVEEFWQTTKCFLDTICIGKLSSTVKKGFQETHHHANCDRNGNELSNPRTMKMVTSIAWRVEEKKRKKSDPFFANSIIACFRAGKTKLVEG